MTIGGFVGYMYGAAYDVRHMEVVGLVIGFALATFLHASTLRMD